MISEQIAELFGTIGFRIDAKGLKLFERRLESLEKQIKSMANGQEKTAKTATKATKDQSDATEQAVKSTKKQVAAVKGLERAYKDLYKNQRKDFKTTVAMLGGKGGDSPMTQFMRQQQAAMQKASAGWVGNVQSKTKNWGKDFQTSLKGLGPQGQSSQSKFYAALQKAEEVSKKKVEQATKNIQIEEGRRLLNARRQQMFNQAEETHKQRMLMMQQRLAQAEARSRGMQQRSQGLFQGNPNQYMGGLGGAIVSTAAGGMGLSYLNQANQDIVSKRIAVQASAGGGEKGIQAWSWLKGEGQRLAFDYRDMAQEYTNLIASFQAGGQTNEVAQQVFRGIMEKSTMLKIAPERRKLIMRAVGQISNKDQLYSEELVGQLSESLPGAIGAMTEAFRLQRGISADVPIKEVGKMMREAMKTGDVKGDILPYFAQVLAARTPEQLAALEKALESSVAAQNRFKNSWSGILEIMSDTAMEKAFFELWTTFSDEMERSAEASKSFSQILKYLFAPLEAFAKLMGDIAVVWLPKMSAALDIGQDKIMAFMLIVGSLFIPIARWVTILGFLVLAIEDVSKGLQGMNSWTKQIFEYFGGGDFQTGAQRILGVAAALLTMALAIKAVRAAGKIGDLFSGKNGQSLADKILGRVAVQRVFVTNWPSVLGGKGVDYNGRDKPKPGDGMNKNGRFGGAASSFAALAVAAGATIGSLQTQPAVADPSGLMKAPLPFEYQAGSTPPERLLSVLAGAFSNVKFTDYRDMYQKTQPTLSQSPLGMFPMQSTLGNMPPINITIHTASDNPEEIGSVVERHLQNTFLKYMPADSQ